jgi:hypothetical protein
MFLYGKKHLFCFVDRNVDLAAKHFNCDYCRVIDVVVCYAVKLGTLLIQLLFDAVSLFAYIW